MDYVRTVRKTVSHDALLQVDNIVKFSCLGRSRLSAAMMMTTGVVKQPFSWRG